MVAPGGVYEEWQKLKRTTTRERFLGAFPHPFLLRQRVRRRTPVPGEIDDDWTDRVAFSTAVVDPAAVAEPTLPAGKLRGARIIPVAKAPGNPFPDRISVGRAQNCDVVLRDQSVSKLHAFFKVLGSGTAELIDAESANGTRVNGGAIEPGKSVVVSGGDSLIFGVVSVQVLEPSKLWDLL